MPVPGLELGKGKKEREGGIVAGDCALYLVNRATYLFFFFYLPPHFPPSCFKLRVVLIVLTVLLF